MKFVSQNVRVAVESEQVPEYFGNLFVYGSGKALAGACPCVFLAGVGFIRGLDGLYSSGLNLYQFLDLINSFNNELATIIIRFQFQVSFIINKGFFIPILG